MKITKARSAEGRRLQRSPSTDLTAQPKQRRDAMQFRQGDVHIEKINGPIPATAKEEPRDEAGRIVLAHGEVTGHAHALLDEGVVLYRDAVTGDVLLSVGAGGASVRHEEHATIPLGEGIYKITRQREYSPEQVRNVAD
jgi:hypothetical protein